LLRLGDRFFISHEDIRQIAIGLPGAIERASYGGRPSWRTKAKMFVWIRENPEALVPWVEFLDEKEALIAAQPKKSFTTSHYDTEPIVLARLAKVTKAEAVDLIAESWRNRATKTAVKDWDAAQG
jgi:hypothetical protein